LGIKTNLFSSLGIKITSHRPVHGGDINQAYCLEGDNKYFLKLNDAGKFPNMFQKEAEGLNALGVAAGLKIPKVIKVGEVEDQQYLLLEWIENESATNSHWINFGQGLAKMHLQRQEYFGWVNDNYIGSLVQVNERCDTWSEFFTQYRILPLVKQLHDRGSFSKTDVAIAERFCLSADTLFPEEPPSLIHGDLWSGNFIITGNNNVALIDPAVYYGHREMDIGMSKLFGGFPQIFYDAYNESYPLENGWNERLKYSQLYPLLVHAVLFGGHYVSQAKQVFFTT
jgi:protein-ribulosamine 3-kinase